MRKIKIMEVYGDSCYECSHADFKITDWDEVTEEEFTELLDWSYRKNSRRKTYGNAYYIIAYHTNDIPNTLAEYKEMIKEDVIKAAAQKVTKEEVAEKRKKNKEKKERKQLEELKKKYENAGVA